MQLITAIDTADALSPNHFTTDEKLMWCNEVSLALRRNVKKYYDEIVTKVNCPEELELPDDIAVDDVEAIYIGGRPLTKTDLRSLPYLSGDVLQSRFGINYPKLMRVIYLTTPKEVKDIYVDGNFDISENKIVGSELPLSEGDAIVCDMPDSEDFEPTATYVYQNDGEALWLTDDIFTPETGAHITIKRIIDDETEAEAPYDRMYIEYLLAKMALYQHDYDTYSAHMIEYNNIYDEYKRDYKTRCPLNDLARFKNIW